MIKKYFRNYLDRIQMVISLGGNRIVPVHSNVIKKKMEKGRKDALILLEIILQKWIKKKNFRQMK